MAFEVQAVKTELGNVKGVFSWPCSARWSHAVHVPGRQECNTLAHAARTHGLGWRTAHASSIDVKGLIVYP